MKICNIGHARSRSSLINRWLANYFSLQNLDEEYKFIKQSVYSNNTNNINESLKQKYQKKIKNKTESIFLNQKFIIKIWPRFLNFSLYCQNYNCYLSDIILNFNLSGYDKIIVTKRNPVSSVCSLWLAKKYGYNYLNLELERPTIDYYLNRKNNIHTLPNFYNDKEIRSFIVEILLIDKISKYLDCNNIKYDYLDYEEIPAYLQQYNLDNCEQLYELPIPSNINYSSTIKNFKDVEETIQKIIEEESKKINNFELNYL